MTTTVIAGIRRATLAVCVLASGAASSAFAGDGDAYWHGIKNADWNEGISPGGGVSNWYSRPPSPPASGTPLPPPTGVAIFADGGSNSVTITRRTEIATMRFLPDAPQYGFLISGLTKDLTLHGRGILNQSAATPRIVIADKATLQFTNAARIVSGGGKGVDFTVLSGGLFFDDDSNGGDARVFNTNNGPRRGNIIFSDRSSAGRMAITNVGKAQTWFRERSTGGEAHFDNNADFNQEGGVLTFGDTTGPSEDRRITAGKIANNAGIVVIGHNELAVREDFIQRTEGELVFWVSGARAGSMRVRGKTRIGGTLIIHGSEPQVGRHILIRAPGGRTGSFSSVRFTGFHNDVKGPCRLFGHRRRLVRRARMSEA